LHTLEITIQRMHEGVWPVVVRHQPGSTTLTLWANGILKLDLRQLHFHFIADKEYGILLGKELFRDEVRDTFVRAVSSAGDKPLRVYLIVEADELRLLHWEQLCAPFEGGRWDYLLLNQKSPFSLYLPSLIERRFPPIGRRDLRALLLVAGPEDLKTDYKLAPFDVPETIASTRTALGDVPSDVLASVKGAVGLPTLDALCERLTIEPYTLLHIVCHGAYNKEHGDTIMFFPKDNQRVRLVTGDELITRLSRLRPAHGLPHFTFLSTCESAVPQAENGLGGLGQRLVRDLGMPAVLAMTDRVSILTAQALAAAFYNRLIEHGEVDRALVEALTGLQGRFDVTVPALFSRLGGHPLFSNALDRPLSETEISFGLELLHSLLKQRAPVLLPMFEGYAANLQATLGARAAALSPEALGERENAMNAINQLSNQAIDLSFNALALGENPPEYDDRCPFRGLYPFRVEDREFFFGRQALVEKMSKRLNNHNFLAILGPSGCGKSSLVLAGLVPTLGFSMIYLTPGRDPLVNLETALAEINLGSTEHYTVVVDQFEELFTLCRDEYQRRTFIHRILNLGTKCHTILTMRADFWGECAIYPELKEEMQIHQELVGPLKAAELRRAMERQADHVGLRFDAGLGEIILDDVLGEPGAMPLLQHALLLLWQHRHGRWLRRDEYTAIGGIKQAIAHTAEMVHTGLSDFERTRVRDIFVRLTRLEDEATKEDMRDTRRRVKIAELVPAGSDPAVTVTLVKSLADARLLVTSLNIVSNQEEVEVAHEALIRHWPRLRTWINEGSDWLRMHEGVRQAALEWQAHGREDAYLLHRGGRLEDAAALSKAAKIALNELEDAYLEACIDLRERERREKEEQQRRELYAAQVLAEEQRARADEQTATAASIRRRALVITAVAVVAVVLAILSGLFYFQAQDNLAVARSRLALLASILPQEDQDLATLLRIEAYPFYDLTQIQTVLISPVMLGSIAWSPDGKLAAGTIDGTVLVYGT
jgi:energy-coupling factor transporter ATP-binding protein EcfA2